MKKWNRAGLGPERSTRRPRIRRSGGKVEQSPVDLEALMTEDEQSV
jgi:hypothetical protein